MSRIYEALQILLILRTGRWTMEGFAAEFAIYGRAAYRLVEVLRDAGVTVELSEESREGKGSPARYCEAPADP